MISLIVPKFSPPLKVHVHDFSAHPFQAQLSNQFAKLGFEILHSYFDRPGQKKALLRDTLNTKRIRFQGISLKFPYQVQNLPKRLLFEILFGARLTRLNSREKPDLVLMSNAPLVSALIFRLLNRNIPFVLWHQDVMSTALSVKFEDDNVANKFSRLVLIKFVEFLEKYLLTSSTQIIGICDHFQNLYTTWGIDNSKVTIIENWAPLDQFHPKRNQNIELSTLKLIYSGTLGMKHDPSLLVNLVKKLRSHSLNVRLDIISEGEKIDNLKSSIDKSLPISFLNYLPISDLNTKLSESHIALMILEKNASLFSVPSKTYSYLASGKLVIAFAPAENSSSKSIINAGGLVFDPDEDGVNQAVLFILGLDARLIEKLENQAREYAESHFDISQKTQLFLKVLERCFTS
jgi:glycosyltransferase involved in cell wall biosynthesis